MEETFPLVFPAWAESQLSVLHLQTWCCFSCRIPSPDVAAVSLLQFGWVSCRRDLELLQVVVSTPPGATAPPPAYPSLSPLLWLMPNPAGPQSVSRKTSLRTSLLPRYNCGAKIGIFWRGKFQFLGKLQNLEKVLSSVFNLRLRGDAFWGIKQVSLASWWHSNSNFNSAHHHDSRQ